MLDGGLATLFTVVGFVVIVIHIAIIKLPLRTVFLAGFLLALGTISLLIMFDEQEQRILRENPGAAIYIRR